MLGLAVMDVLDRGVVAERDDLDALQSHDAVGLGPAPVVADAHAHDGALHAPDAEAFVPDIEIALLQMLKWRLRQMLGMAGEMDLAVPADDAAIGINEDRRVVMPRLALLLGQLGIAEIKADAELLREIEQRPRLRARHIALEIAVDLGLVGHPIAREERRQCQLGKDDKLDAGAVCLAQQGAEPLDDGLAAVSEMDRTQLGDGGAKLAGHSGSPELPSAETVTARGPTQFPEGYPIDRIAR